MSLNKTQALNAAKQYVLQRNVQAAVEVYRKIIEADPTDLTSINTLGDLYAGAGRPQEAIAEFSRAAACYIEGGFTRKAIATLKKIIVLDPENVETEIKLADMFAQAGLPSEARQHYLQIADALTRKGQTLEALNVFSKTVDLDPSNTSTRIKLGELYLREGMNEKAFESFVTAADQLAAKSEHRRALNAYNEALAIRPDSVDALAAARKQMTALGVADPDKTLRAAVSQTVERVDHAKHSSSEASGSPKPSTPLDQQPGSDSFVIQEISKAEILVAYGKVNQAVTMLRDVLRGKPDSIDVHVKLKDIYLRTGMMTEAAHECAELERIHDARGESERARDYAVRASRLTHLIEHPSGDLPEPGRKPVQEAARRVDTAPPLPVTLESPKPRPVTRLEAPPAPLTVTVESPKPRTATRLEAPPAQPNRMTISVIAAEPAPVEPTPNPAPDPPLASHPIPIELAPIPAVGLDRAPLGETALVLSTRPIAEANARPLPALFGSATPVITKRRRLNAATVAAAVSALLGISAAIGGFAYDAHLNTQYQALALAAPLELPAPPDVLVSDEPPAVQESEPITVDVTPTVQPDASAQKQSREPEATRKETPSQPQPVADPPKVATKPSPVLPRTALGSDGRTGTESGLPAGVPVSVPIGAAQPAEPPPRAVRQSPGVVPGSAVKKVDPVYPAAARNARQGGAVTVEVTVNEQGNVTSARAVSGSPLLQNAAVMAARAWKFKPSTLGGVPVTTTTTIVFNFKL